MATRSRHRAISTVLVVALIAWAEAGTRATAAMPLQIAGLYLGMRLEEFRMRHGDAIITETTPVRYCYGQPVALREFSRLEATVAHGRARLAVAFVRRGSDYWISTIKMRQEISPRPERIRQIRDALVRKFGPVDRILRRRKLEPAGLIAGFQWNAPGAASLTARIHRDHAEDPRRSYVTSTLTNLMPESRKLRSSGRLPICRRTGEDG